MLSGVTNLVPPEEGHVPLIIDTQVWVYACAHTYNFRIGSQLLPTEQIIIDVNSLLG